MVRTIKENFPDKFFLICPSSFLLFSKIFQKTKSNFRSNFRKFTRGAGASASAYFWQVKITMVLDASTAICWAFPLLLNCLWFIVYDFCLEYSNVKKIYRCRNHFYKYFVCENYFWICSKAVTLFTKLISWTINISSS